MAHVCVHGLQEMPAAPAAFEPKEL